VVLVVGIGGWKKWFYEDFLSKSWSKKETKNDESTWTDKEYIAFMQKSGLAHLL
jgi:DNA-binding MltR family transcriptional regulator